MTTKVKQGQKPNSDISQSLDLDFYPAISHLATGKQTWRKFLGLYFFDNAKSPIVK